MCLFVVLVAAFLISCDFNIFFLFFFYRTRRKRYRTKRIFRMVAEEEEPVVFSDNEEDITELELRGENQCSSDRNGTTGRVSPAVHQDAESDAAMEERAKGVDAAAAAAAAASAASATSAEQTAFRVTWV